MWSVFEKTGGPQVAGLRLLVTAVHAAWIVPVMLGNVNTASRWTVACCMYFYICRYINVCSNSARSMLHLHCVSLKKGALESFETSFTVYSTTQRNIPEDSNLQQRRCENNQSSRSCLILLCLSSLWSILHIHYCSGDKIEKNEMGRACSTYGGLERRIQGFGGETWGNETTWETEA